MPDALANLTVGEVLLWITGVTALVTVVAKFWKPLKAVSGFLADWNGRPEKKDFAGQTTQQAEPGVAARILQLERDVKRIHHEVTPNHGGSLNDKVARSEAQGKDTAAKVAELAAKFERHVGISKEHDDAAEVTARKLDEHIEQTEKWTEMLQDLHRQWADKHPWPPGGGKES